MLAQQHAQERAEMSNLAGENTDLNRQNADLNRRLRDAVNKAERKEAVCRWRYLRASCYMYLNVLGQQDDRPVEGCRQQG